MRISLALLLVGCATPPAKERPTHPPAGSSDDSTSGDSESGAEAEADGDTGSHLDVETGDDARIVESLFPTEIGCGELAEGVVVVQNTGTTQWTHAEGFKLGAFGDEDPLFDSDGVRVWLDDETIVAPGESHEFSIDLFGPETEGIATTDWQMVHESVHWFGEIARADVLVRCGDDPSVEPDDTPPALPLPDMSHIVDELADERPDLLADSCLADGGSWGFLDMLVDRLRETDERWGYNWKRGVVGDASQDVVDYHYGSGVAEGSAEVYIIDVIVNHCSDAPEPGWLDQTEATADAGTIGIWTGRERF